MALEKNSAQGDLLSGGIQEEDEAQIQSPIPYSELWERLDQRQAEGRILEKVEALLTQFLDITEERMFGLKNEHVELKKAINEKTGHYMPLSLRIEKKKGSISRSITWFALHFKKNKATGKASRYQTRIRMIADKNKPDPAQMAKNLTEFDTELAEVAETMAQAFRLDAKAGVKVLTVLQHEIKKFKERHKELDRLRQESRF